MTLQESISAALADETVVEKVEKVEEVVVEKSVEKPVEKTKEPVVNEPSDVIEVPESEEEIKQALNIYRTLSNPAQASNYIAELAKTVGLQIKTADVPVTAKVATQTVIDVLREALGEENEDLALKLAPALDKLITQEIKKPLEQLTHEQAAQQVKVEIDATFVKLAAELPDFNKLQNEMTALMADLQPGVKSSPESYLRQLYKLAGGTPAKAVETKTSEKNSKISPAKLVEKLAKNAKETNSNVSSDVDESRIVKQSHRPSIREAVLAAAATLNDKT